MVDVLGHLGMALIWLAPAWFFIEDRRTAILFVGAGFWFGMLPDVDLVLSSLFPDAIHHHGVVHTVLVALVFAAVIGPALGWTLKRLFGGTSWLSWDAADSATALGVIAVGVTTLSHVFADMLSAPDTSTRIEPLWPLVEGPIVRVDVLYYQSFWATIALFAIGLGLNAAFGYWTTRPGTRTA